jgi:malate synthase
VRGAKRGRVRLPGVVINALTAPRQDEILTPRAVAFLADLHRKFDARHRALLQARADPPQRLDIGAPDSPGDSEWTVTPVPADPIGRRTEVARPADRKTIVNALNAGASDCLADFQDVEPAAWLNGIAGQANLKDLWDGKIDFTDPENGERYALGPQPSALILRPRGWDMTEGHVLVDGAPISAALFDFGLYFFHNARTQIAKGATPSFHLSKLESYREARLWNDVFVFAREKLDIPKGAIRATVLIARLPAFEIIC